MINLFDIQQYQQFDSIELVANQVVEGFLTGMHKSPFHGFSVEFAEHRIYNKGESTRHIDWKLYARTDKLYIKKYEEETNLRCQILIDTSSSMLFPFPNSVINKLSFAVYASAALIYLLKRQRDAVGLTLFDSTIKFHTDAHITTSHTHRLITELERVANMARQSDAINKSTNIVESLHQIADTIHKRSLVVLFSDMLQNSNLNEIFEALQHLKYNKHEIILFHVVDKSKEFSFEFENRPYKFIDLENGQIIKVRPNEVKTEYQKKATSYFEMLKLKCQQYNIDLFESDINQPFDQILMAYFIKRNKMY